MQAQITQSMSKSNLTQSNFRFVFAGSTAGLVLSLLLIGAAYLQLQQTSSFLVSSAYIGNEQQLESGLALSSPTTLQEYSDLLSVMDAQKTKISDAEREETLMMMRKQISEDLNRAQAAKFADMQTQLLHIKGQKTLQSALAYVETALKFINGKADKKSLGLQQRRLASQITDFSKARESVLIDKSVRSPASL